MASDREEYGGMLFSSGLKERVSCAPPSFTSLVTIHESVLDTIYKEVAFNESCNWLRKSQELDPTAVPFARKYLFEGGVLQGLP